VVTSFYTNPHGLSLFSCRTSYYNPSNKKVVFGIEALVWVPCYDILAPRFLEEDKIDGIQVLEQVQHKWQHHQG